MAEPLASLAEDAVVPILHFERWKVRVDLFFETREARLDVRLVEIGYREVACPPGDEPFGRTKGDSCVNGGAPPDAFGGRDRDVEAPRRDGSVVLEQPHHVRL